MGSKILTVSDFWSTISSVTWNQSANGVELGQTKWETENGIGWIGNRTQMRQRHSSASLPYCCEMKPVSTSVHILHVQPTGTEQASFNLNSDPTLQPMGTAVSIFVHTLHHSPWELNRPVSTSIQPTGTEQTSFNLSSHPTLQLTGTELTIVGVTAAGGRTPQLREEGEEDSSWLLLWHYSESALQRGAPVWRYCRVCVRVCTCMCA